MSIKIQLSSNAASIARELGQFRGLALQEMAAAMDVENQATIRHIAQNKLSRRGSTTLGVVTNRLRGSLRASRTSVGSSGIEGSIGTNVEYAGVHEFGATIKAKNGPYLHFNVGGQWVRKKSVTIPARPFLSTGIQERADSYAVALSKAIEEAWNR